MPRVVLNSMPITSPRCGASRYPLDDRLGVAGFVSPHARKLLTLAGASWSFAAAAAHLTEFCGLRTCDQTIRAVCFEEAGLVADWLHGDPAAGAAFAAASGDIELQTDGTMVNTWEGWREMRLGVFARRERGRPATAAEWDTRRLPPPSARVLFAGVETAEHFGPRTRRWASRLGIRDAAEITVLADGADWIRNQTRRQLPGAAQLLDIFHASEHLADCAKALYGEGSARARAWVDAGRGAAAGGVGRGAGAPGGGPGRGAVGGEAVGAFGRGRLLRAAGRTVGLRGASGGGAVDRQRPGGGGVQAGDQPPHEADGGALAGAAGQPHGDSVLHLPRRSLGRLLAAPPQLTPGIGARTRQGMRGAI